MTATTELPIDVARPEAPAVDDLIRSVAVSFGVDQETACQWLCARASDIESWTPEVMPA